MRRILNNQHHPITASALVKGPLGDQVLSHTFAPGESSLEDEAYQALKECIFFEAGHLSCLNPSSKSPEQLSKEAEASSKAPAGKPSGKGK